MTRQAVPARTETVKGHSATTAARRRQHRWGVQGQEVGRHRSRQTAAQSHRTVTLRLHPVRQTAMWTPRGARQRHRQRQRQRHRQRQRQRGLWLWLWLGLGPEKEHRHRKEMLTTWAQRRRMVHQTEKLWRQER